MARTIKKYKVGVDSETYAVSLVDEPAIESDFVALAKDKPIEEVKLSSDERHMLYGAALIPDKEIYRYDGENEYFLSFTKESIEKMSQDFFKNFRQANVTIDHEEAAKDITIVESWLVEDPYRDKANALGLENLPIGTWMLGMKVNEIDTWERVKSGELRGFSVESLISLEDFSKNVKNEDMDNVMLFEKIKEFITELFKGDDGFKSEERNEQFEAEPAQTEPVQPVEPAPEPTPEPEPAPEPTPEPQPVVDPEPTEPAQPTEPAVNEELIRTIDNLKAEIESLKALNEGLQHKVDDLGKLPSAKPVGSVGGGASGTGRDSYAAWRDQMSKWL